MYRSHSLGVSPTNPHPNFIETDWGLKRYCTEWERWESKGGGVNLWWSYGGESKFKLEAIIDRNIAEDFGGGSWRGDHF